MKALIVDDEPLAREGIRLLLGEQPGIESIAEARDGREAVAAIRELKPDVVFLDVQMPEMDGFDVVRALGEDLAPAVVFVTAHDRYAIDAFELNAIDYLLKPVSRERFQTTLARLRERAASRAGNQQMMALLQSLAAPPRYLARLAVRTAGRIVFVAVDEIEWLQAAENYVQLNLRDARHLLHVPINTLQASLDPQHFLRIHRSLIVNTRHIKELQTGAHGEYVVVLRGGTQLQSSRTYHEAIKRWAANPF